MSENHHNGNAPDMQDTATDSQGKDGMKWQVLEREYLFRRPWLTVRRDKVRLPNGNINPEFYVLEYPDWVNVIALTEDGHIVMERQYRHGIGSTGWEIPAGVCEPGESPEQSARRELYEETGYSGGTWIPNLTSTPNASTSNNRCHSFIATGVKKTSDQHLEATEDITVHLLTEEEVHRLMLNGEISQATMLSSLWKYFAEKNVTP